MAKKEEKIEFLYNKKVEPLDSTLKQSGQDCGDRDILRGLIEDQMYEYNLYQQKYILKKS